MPVHLKVGGIWKQISATWIKISSVWRSSTMWMKVSGTWRLAALTTPATPTLLQTNNADGTYSISTGSYSVTNGSGVHGSTDWQLAETSDTTFSSPVYSSLSDSTNKTSINLHDKSLPDGKQYIMRARWIASDGGTGNWSTSYNVFTPPNFSFTGSSYNSHSFSVTAYSGLSGFTHNTCDYALSRTSDTSFSSTAYSVTAQNASSYSASTNLVGNSNYYGRVKANFSGSRDSPYKVKTVTTGSYTFTATYTSNSTFTAPYGPSAASVSIYVECGGSRAGGSCNTDGYGAKVGGNVELSHLTSYYAYPANIGGGGGCACGGGGGSGSVFTTTGSAAIVIAGGGGSVRQCCHCCGCDCDGCGGGGGLAGGYNINGSYGCGSGAGGSWGGSVSGTNQVSTRGNFGAGGGSPCQGGSNFINVTPTTNTYHTGSAYVYVSY